MFAFFIACIGPPIQAQKHEYLKTSRVELDSETQSIKAEILEINREILLLEESLLYPPDEQLIVFVSIPNGSTVIPQSIILRLNGKTVSQHNYSKDEGTALQQGGVHRLYTGRLVEGNHQLDIAISGRRGGNKALQRERSLTFRKLPGQKTVELQLGSADRKSKADVIIREWQQ